MLLTLDIKRLTRGTIAPAAQTTDPSLEYPRPHGGTVFLCQVRTTCCALCWLTPPETLGNPCFAVPRHIVWWVRFCAYRGIFPLIQPSPNRMIIVDRVTRGGGRAAGSSSYLSSPGNM